MYSSVPVAHVFHLIVETNLKGKADLNLGKVEGKFLDVRSRRSREGLEFLMGGE